MNTETLNQIGSLTKEQLLAMWKAQQNSINNCRSWRNYLENLADTTGFNQLVVSNLVRVELKYVDKYGSFEEAEKHFDEIREETKEMCMWLPYFKEYFGVRTKKDMMNYDLSLYKFE